MAFVGAKREVALTKEATRGTADGPDSGDFILHQGHTVRPMTEKIEHQGANGTIAQRHASVVNKEWTEGSVPFILEGSKLWLLGALITGADPSTSGSDPYTHAYTLDNTNAHKTFTVSYTDPVLGDVQAPNGLADVVSLSATPDDYVVSTLDLVAGKTESATFTPSYSSSNITYFSPSTISFKYADNYAGLSGASATAVEGLNLTVNKNVDPYWVLGSTEIGEIYNQRISVTGDVTLIYESTALRTLALGNTTKAVQLALSSGDFSLIIELPTVDFQDWSDTEDLDGYVTQTLTFNATDADATNGLIKVTAIDKTATH